MGKVISLKDYVTDLKLMDQLATRRARKAVTVSQAQDATNKIFNHMDAVFMQFDSINKQPKAG